MIESNEFTLIDYSKEEYSISIEADEAAPHRIVSIDDAVLFTCKVTGVNKLKDKINYSYQWYRYESFTGSSFESGVDYFTRSVVINEDSDKETVTFTKTSHTSPVEGTIYYVKIAFGTTPKLRLHGGVELATQSDLTQFKVSGSNIYDVECVVTFTPDSSASMNNWSESTDLITVQSYLDSGISIKEGYAYYISYNRGVAFTEPSSGTLKENNWSISDSTRAGASWSRLSGGREGLYNLDLSSYNTSKIWYVYYTYRQEYWNSETEPTMLDCTDWAYPQIIREIEYKEGKWVDILSGTELNQLNIFNSLTNNGRDDGVFYSTEGYTITADKTPQQGKTYYIKESYKKAIITDFKLNFIASQKSSLYIVTNNVYQQLGDDTLWDPALTYFTYDEENQIYSVVDTEAEFKEYFKATDFLDDKQYFLAVEGGKY